MNAPLRLTNVIPVYVNVEAIPHVPVEVIIVFQENASVESAPCVLELVIRVLLGNVSVDPRLHAQ